MPKYTDTITIHGAEFEVDYYFEPSDGTSINDNSYLEIHEISLKSPPESWLEFFEDLFAELSEQQIPFLEFLENELREQLNI